MCQKSLWHVWKCENFRVHSLLYTHKEIHPQSKIVICIKLTEGMRAVQLTIIIIVGIVMCSVGIIDLSILNLNDIYYCETREV